VATNSAESTASDEWATALVKRVGEAAKALRGKRSAKWLSDRTAELGYRISPQVIARLDSARRAGHLELAELIVLAAALEVPPALLAVPLGRGEVIELLPSQEVDQWGAFELFTGKVGRGRETIELFAEHANWVLEVFAAGGRAAQWKHWAADESATEEDRKRSSEQAELSQKIVQDAERAVLGCRARMAASGLTPPRLPAELADLHLVVGSEGGDDAS